MNAHVTPVSGISCDVKYYGPTNFKGARVRLKFDRYKKRIFLPYDHALRDAEHIALTFLNSYGIECEFRVCTNEGTIFFISSPYIGRVYDLLASR